MMKRVLTLVYLGILSAAAMAEDIEKRLDAAADGVVSISNVSGSVEVSGWSRNEVEVSGTLGQDVRELIFERNDDEIEITVKAPKGGNQDISSDLIIKVPEKSSVEVATVSADIEVRDVFGELRLQSVSGDVDCEAYAADIKITSVSGDIDVQGDGKRARAELNSVSGDIEVQHIAGEANLNSVSGDLVMVDGKFERVRLETVNGDIAFSAVMSEGGVFDLETINGDLDIKFDDSISARFDVETFNGDIRNCFGPEPVRTSRYTPGTELKFTEGGGKGRVTIKSLNGDLRLCKG